MKKRKCIFLIAFALFIGFFVKSTVYASEGTIIVRTAADEKVCLYKISNENSYEEEGKNYKGKTARELFEYVKKYAIEGQNKTKDSDNRVRFENLDKGLYLVTQGDAFEPFLVSVPMMADGKEIYEIETFPKVGEEGPEEEKTDEPQKPLTPEKNDSRLPQTGQMNWPVPVLAMAGIIFFTIGWILCFGKKGR